MPYCLCRPHARTVHVSFVPDEEIGGHDGLAKFVLTSKFKEMNVGFGLDEGLASPTDEVDIFYAERNEYWVCCFYQHFVYCIFGCLV